MEKSTWHRVFDIWASLNRSWSSLRSELNISSSPMYAQRE
eukprot:Gb_02082 [translate_table: standard]